MNMTNAKVIGRLAKVAVNDEFAAMDKLSAHSMERLREWVENMNARKDGNFKLVVGWSEDRVAGGIDAQLHDILKRMGRQEWKPFVKFRVNYNEIDEEGFTWEGFQISNDRWYNLL